MAFQNNGGNNITHNFEVECNGVIFRDKVTQWDVGNPEKDKAFEDSIACVLSQVTKNVLVPTLKELGGADKNNTLKIGGGAPDEMALPAPQTPKAPSQKAPSNSPSILLGDLNKELQSKNMIKKGRTTFFEELKNNKILQKNLTPYQDYVHFFEVTHNEKFNTYTSKVKVSKKEEFVEMLINKGIATEPTKKEVRIQILEVIDNIGGKKGFLTVGSISEVERETGGKGRGIKKSLSCGSKFKGYDGKEYIARYV